MSADPTYELAACFGDNLRRYRQRAGMSQEEVAIAAGLHRTEIGLLERGTRTPRIDTLVKLAAVLSIPPEQLLAGITWRPGGTVAGEFTVRLDD